MTEYYAPLPERGVFAVSGADAKPFLQGLITNDINKVTETQAIFAALLSPQGKFLYDFFIIEHEGKLLFDTDKARLPELIKRLTMYKLRSQVEFTLMPEWQVTAMEEGETTAEHICYADPRLPMLGVRVLSTRPIIADAIGDYDRQRLMLGVPDGAKDLIFDRSLLLEYGYDELHGVDFNKGCYVGQEVTARSKHRATLRKFIHQVKADSPLPPSGTPVMAGEREVGVMASSSGEIGLAVLRVEDAERAKAQNISLTASGARLTATLPAWCATNFATERENG